MTNMLQVLKTCYIRSIKNKYNVIMKKSETRGKIS